jgi:hypothetical protein
MPSRGRKIWEASTLPSETRPDPLHRRVVPNEKRLSSHKPLLMWRFLALCGTLSGGLGFRKLIQERSYGFQTAEQVHLRPNYYSTVHENKVSARNLPRLPIVYHTFPIRQMHLRRFSMTQSAYSIRPSHIPSVRASGAASLGDRSFGPARIERQRAWRSRA